ncbi:MULTISPECIES: hypothetical protein [Bradyrhizobium]|uniref:hypothetical protein n=1 Tax=Bradyrhizobium TaxID=374 RepID=UPI001B8A6700|nr:MULTISPECIES: hypothetical protein [Bradyrhizobium]MBR0973001.1 hypothetical protein [Bradyrhizobium japonicum]
MLLSQPFSDDTDDYRAMIATAVALACCAIGLVVVTLLLVTGDRFEFRPPPETATLDDNLVRSFEALDGMAARMARVKTGDAWTTPGQDSKPAGIGNLAVEPTRRHIVTRLKSPWCTGILAHQPFHTCRPRPQ